MYFVSIVLVVCGMASRGTLPCTSKVTDNTDFLRTTGRFPQNEKNWFADEEVHNLTRE